MKFLDSTLPFSTLFLAVILTGCHQSPAIAPKKTVEQVIPPTAAETEAAQLQQCQKSLEVLRSVKSQQYSEYKQAFEVLMRGAAQYSGLRSRIKTDTQDTVDALYRYRVSKLCAQINQALLLGLTEKGESVQ